jgi:hypothetical protein
VLMARSLLGRRRGTLTWRGRPVVPGGPERWDTMAR